MYMNKVILSIIMSVYNGDKFISYTLDSIIAQTYKDWELIILDNCSDDETSNILRKYEKEKNITVIKEKLKLPRTKALNTVFKKISKDSLFVMNMDADDKLNKNWSQIAISFLQKNTNIGCVSGWAKIINEKGIEIEKFKVLEEPGTINHLFSYTFPIVHSSTIFRKSCFSGEQKPYNEKIVIGQDWDLCVRLLNKCKFYYLDKHAVYWRRYGLSITGKLENQVQSRLDKIYNISQGYRYANSINLIIKNRSRIGIENLALSILYLKNNDYKNFLFKFLLSITQNPFALFLNQKLLQIIGIKKEFYK